MALADVSDVTLVCLLPGHDDDRRHLNSLGEVCREVHAVGRSDWGYARNRTLPRPLVWLRSVAEYCHPTEPAWLRWYESQVASRLVGELCRSRFDLIWVERLPSLRLLPSARSERIVVDLDDLEHRKLGHRLRSAPFHRLLPFHGLEYLKLRRLERGLARLPYELAVCSTLDRQILDGDARVWVIPNGINLPEPLPHVTASVQPAERSKPGAPVFLFVGTLGYVANVDAVQYFARRILPRIRRDVPGARFLIVGREPSPQVQRLHDGDTTSVVGSVPDVAPFLRQAAVVVVPLRFGGGTRIKILEALAYRVPVVSTSVGAEGLEVESGKHLLLADSPSAFAQCCLRLLADPALREHLTAQGFELVRAKYEWRAIQSLVKTIVINAAPLPVVATTSSSA
jgi:glycosyltransferase involved in cell wall biosynthesis